ncbi:MAG: MltA domain-containing protein [Rhodobacterales bacterium]|nr:MltA domain-containing protein [Rhodobacterales bacterium]
MTWGGGRAARGLLAALALPVLLAGCGLREARLGEPPPAKLSLTPVPFKALPGWLDAKLAPALPALRRSCAVIMAKTNDAPLSGVGSISLIGGYIRDWRPACADLERTADGDERLARYFFEKWFEPFRAANNGNQDGRFTGYYEPELEGSWQRSARFHVPLYKLPDDIISVDLGAFDVADKGRSVAGRLEGRRIIPYADRAEIEAGALEGRGLELLWVDSPVDAFFLHVQGSGRIRLPDGSTVRVGYAGRNGHRYSSIGRFLVAEGRIALKDASLQTIRAWLLAHPAEGRQVMQRNKSYVFFRMVEGDGPVGAQGVVLTPEHSLAVDRSFIPLGVPLWLDTTDPRPQAKGAPLRRLVVAQDTGSAITGPLRGDLFWGHGLLAGLAAGPMNQEGDLYLLLPKGVGAPH